jgi:uncharacterized protein with PQ loop repeat
MMVQKFEDLSTPIPIKPKEIPMRHHLDILSTIAICVFILSTLPQIRKLLMHRTAKDISGWMALLVTVGNFLMLVRAISIRDFFFSLNYAFQLALWLAIIVLICVYRGKL